jgi:putative transposase
MTTHVHMVVETPLPNLSRGLQWLFSVHAQQFNERWGRFGHLFADRFSSRVIKEDDYFEDVCRYVFENPVKAGLCARASEWRWSGGRIFAALMQAPGAL